MYDHIALAKVQLASIVQDMMVHIWCQHRGYINGDENADLNVEGFEEEDPFDNLMQQDFEEEELGGDFSNIGIQGGDELLQIPAVLGTQVKRPAWAQRRGADR